MSRAGSRWTRAARAAACEVGIPIGAAAAAGAATAALVAPEWRAPGLPYALGYGKNVEIAAVGAALAVGAASGLLPRLRGGLVLGAMGAASGFALIARRADLGALLGAAPQLLFVAALATALGALAPRGARAPVDRTPPWVAAPLLAALALAAGILGIEALEVDVFHHGEILASAVDLVHGGRPFETFLWPHGFHDSGLAALWIVATGKIGTSPVALARASWLVLGILSAYCLSRRLLGSRVEALAVCVVLVLGPVLLAGIPRRLAATFALQQLGILLFVVLGMTSLTSRRRHRELLAGACFGLAYLFRIETGVFGLAAALAVLVQRGWVEAQASRAGALRSLGRALLLLLLGLAIVLGGARLVLGWPGPEWFAYTLGALPRYHRDAVGIPFPWPLRGHVVAAALRRQAPVARLVFVLLLGVQALRFAVARDQGDAPRRAWTSQLVFLAVFAALAAHSSLERSDEGHLMQWMILPLLGALLLVLAGIRERLAWSGERSAAVLAGGLALLDLGSLSIGVPHLRGAGEVAASGAASGRLLAEHLAPNPAVGACRELLFTAMEAERNRPLIDDSCAVERLLRAHGIGDLVIEHSAPWHYVRFGMALPSRYYAFARAYTPQSQSELVADLRRHRAGALLRVRGYGAIREFDVPDPLRVPVVDAYLRERRRDAPVVATPIGDLYLWNEAPTCPSPGRSGPDGSGARLVVDAAWYQPRTEALVAQGWGADAAGRQPLAALEPVDAALGPGASLEYGLSRPDVADAFRAPALARTGWELVGQVAPGAWAELRERGVAVRARFADGRAESLELSLAAARPLGALAGPEWSDLDAERERAAALGRIDRSADCGIVGAVGQ